MRNVDPWAGGPRNNQTVTAIQVLANVPKTHLRKEPHQQRMLRTLVTNRAALHVDPVTQSNLRISPRDAHANPWLWHTKVQDESVKRELGGC